MCVEIATLMQLVCKPVSCHIYSTVPLVMPRQGVYEKARREAHPVMPLL